MNYDRYTDRDILEGQLDVALRLERILDHIRGLLIVMLGVGTIVGFMILSIL